MDIRSFIKIAKAKIIHPFFPYICIFCSERTKREIDLCIDCEKNLPWLNQVCIHCAAPLPSNINSICGTCLKTPLPFYKICILFSYTPAIKKLITGLKFQQRLLYGNILRTLLAEKVALLYQQEDLPEIIIPVPLHKKRFRERGFNQAIELARPIKKKLKIPIDHTSCIRLRNTAAQSTLPAHQRAINVKNAFIIRKRPAAQHVTLLDDVMTTGHTLIELSRALYDTGVKRIDVWCCARTYLSNL